MPDFSARLSALEAAAECLRAAEQQRAAAAAFQERSQRAAASAFQQHQLPSALETLLTQHHDLLARMVLAIESLSASLAVLTELERERGGH